MRIEKSDAKAVRDLVGGVQLRATLSYKFAQRQSLGVKFLATINLQSTIYKTFLTLERFMKNPRSSLP